MKLIEFDKEQLINLEFSLNRELLRTNRAGTYASTTIIGCNTRKYHGLLVCPMENIDNDNHVLLSGVDVSVIQHDATFHLGVRKYSGGVYDPKGHKYARNFVVDKMPKLTYRVGDVVLEMERILSQDDRILIKYTLVEAHSPTKLQLNPFLAFRNVHKLSKANSFVDKTFKKIENGITVNMYDGYKPLYMQFNKEVDYFHVPDWYYNVEYEEEQKRGYDFKEDLYVPGYFEFMIKKGESVVFTASLIEVNPKEIIKKFDTEIEKRTVRTTYLDCLKSAAQQFICRRNHKTEIIAGFPWFGRWGRDTFISLPGITLYNDADEKTCKDVIDTMLSELNHGLFPNIGSGNQAALNSVDAPLWFFWTLQQYSYFVKDKKTLWKEYGEKIKQILNCYRQGTSFNIKMHDNGLVWSGVPDKALTWMDAMVDNKAVTPRMGFCVEINALWYNAVMFSLELAKLNNDLTFLDEWTNISELTKENFIKFFWDTNSECLFDYVTYDYKDKSIRPNQIFACSLPYSLIEEEFQQKIIEFVRKNLLTIKGIRTLSPKDPRYKGIYEGNQLDRDLAYHQGTVWVWLLGAFCESYLKIYGKSGLSFVEKIFNGFEEDMTTYGIATISEIYDGDPPHYPKGAVSQAWSVGELLRIYSLIEKYRKL
ncbi:MAG: amylo-alpha-1,6-glucosidase [Bacteroidales bacterium]|jgi:predicted glycogen debranching enzyme|nr:amylo-alpha-1,6-glucosidase [Bacteroidales bacterium]